jgi:hypothetical protein
VPCAEPAQCRQQANGLRAAHLPQDVEQLAGRQQPVLANEAVNLHPEGEEGREVHEGEQAQEHEPRQTEPWRAHEIADEEGQQPGGEGAVGRDLAIAPLRDDGKARDEVPGQEQAARPAEGEGAVHGLGPAADPAVGLDEVNGLRERGHRDVGKARARRLVGLEGEPIARAGPQMLHAAAAEAAVAVPDQEGKGQRSDCSTSTPVVQPS